VHRIEGRDDIVVGFAGRPGGEGRCEDAALVVELGPRSCLLAVADGMGSGPRADDASGQVLACLAARAEALAEEGVGRVQVLDAIEEASQAIRGWGIGAATTLVVAGIDDTGYRTYHVGDSEAVVTGQRGRLKWQTISHSPTGYAQASGLLGPADAIVHEERHLVDSMVGLDGMRVDLGERRTLAARDTLVVATDGVFDNLSVSEVVDTIRTGPLAAAAQALMDRVQERMTAGSGATPGKPDDTAFILYRPSRTRSK
jgi:serine/threonine protein phosphatase PrpC